MHNLYVYNLYYTCYYQSIIINNKSTMMYAVPTYYKLLLLEQNS